VDEIRARDEIASVASRKERILRQYSEFFQTLHDETAPTGSLGRGTHYSILRAVVFGDEEGNMLGSARFQDFAIIWDEDHDDRVMEAIEKIYFGGLLPHFLMFGERKGTFTAIAGSDFPRRELLESRLDAITQRLQVGDCWSSQIADIDEERNGIINDKRDRVSLYLNNLVMLWELGLKPAKFEVPPTPLDESLVSE
jgi:hypothetical protein